MRAVFFLDLKKVEQFKSFILITQNQFNAKKHLNFTV